MEKASLYEAVTTLSNTRFHPRDSPYPYRQAISQYDSLLQVAKRLYPERDDVQAMTIYGLGTPHKHEFGDAVNRLKIALESGNPSAPLSLSKFGIPDSVAFNTQISEMGGQALISCLFMDLDNFKAVNDQHNHSVGDQVIQEAIRITELAIRGKGKIFHRSGDEILVLLPNFDSAEACAVGERIRRGIEEHDFSVIGQGFVTATLGVSTCPTFCTMADLEVSADVAAMEAKKKGKNQVAHSSGFKHGEPPSVRPYSKELQAMLFELRANEAVARLQGNDRIDYSSDKLDPAVLSILPESTKRAVDSAYGAIKKIQLLVRRFEGATSHLAIIDSGNSLIEYKTRELHKITDAIQALQEYLGQETG